MQINSQTSAVIWSKQDCPACTTAKALLDQAGISYVEKVVGTTATKEELYAVVPNARSVPQIFLGTQYIGGLEKLRNKLNSNRDVVTK